MKTENMTVSELQQACKGNSIESRLSKIAKKPPYQRNIGIWRETEQLMLIMTILKDGLIPPMIIAVINGVRYLQDGQQRLYSLLHFIFNEFAFSNRGMNEHERNSIGDGMNDKFFKDLPAAAQRTIMQYKLQFIVKEYSSLEAARNDYWNLQNGKQTTKGERILGIITNGTKTILETIQCWKIWANCISNKKRMMDVEFIANILLMQSKDDPGNSKEVENFMFDLDGKPEEAKHLQRELGEITQDVENILYQTKDSAFSKKANLFNLYSTVSYLKKQGKVLTNLKGCVDELKNFSIAIGKANPKEAAAKVYKTQIIQGSGSAAGRKCMRDILVGKLGKYFS